MQFDHTATPSEDSIPSKPENTRSKLRFQWRWWWLLSIPAAGGIIVLSVFFPQVMNAIGLAVLSAVVTSLVTWVLERFSKGKDA